VALASPDQGLAGILPGGDKVFTASATRATACSRHRPRAGPWRRWSLSASAGCRGCSPAGSRWTATCSDVPMSLDWRPGTHPVRGAGACSSRGDGILFSSPSDACRRAREPWSASR